MDLSKDFEIRSAPNGGIVVLDALDISRGPSGRSPLIAAFTTPADMIGWLAEQYGVDTVVTVNQVMPVLRVKEVSPEPEWITWDGGGRPVSGETRVEVKFREGDTAHVERADYWTWEHRFDVHPRDIVAYRVVAD